MKRREGNPEIGDRHNADTAPPLSDPAEFRSAMIGLVERIVAPA